MHKLYSMAMVVVVLTACGDDADTSGNDGGGGDRPAPVADTIEASEGGTVETEGASVEIPADALAEDTEISIEVLDAAGLPDAEDIASEVYDFGPDGTVFDRPVTLTIEFDADIPNGMRPVMAWLDRDRDRWVPLADSEVSGNAVTATTDHFTPFAVVFTAAAGQVAGRCDDVGSTDCGGDLVGTWEFTLGCLELPDDFLTDENGENPLASCDGVELSGTVDLSGTIRFDEDGTYALNSTQEVEVVVSVPKECLEGRPCDELLDPDNPDQSVEDDGDRCTVISTQSGMNDDAGTYEIDDDGGLYTMPEGETEPGDPTTYCVEGDTLTARVTDAESGVVQVFRATRQ